jgi:MFS family permease
MAIQALGLAVGIALANVLGGIMVDRIGWRSVFVMAGIPGFVLAGLVYFTLRDAPIVLKRSNSKANNEMTNEEKNSNNNNTKSIAVKEFSRACSDAWGSVWECAKEMFQRKTFVYLAIACSLQVAVGLSILTFLPTFFIRSHGMSNQEAGVDIAVVSGACGALGILMMRILLRKC